jgi:hypothetical protein
MDRSITFDNDVGQFCAPMVKRAEWWFLVSFVFYK